MFTILEKKLDNLTKEQRSKNMKRIHSKNTKIEILLRKELWRRGFRYRKNYSILPGKPDIVFIKNKLAIFCDSEFFHGKDWETQKQRIADGNNSEYWLKEIQKNIDRDQNVNKQLESLGWKVLRFWGKDIEKHTEACICVIEKHLEKKNEEIQKQHSVSSHHVSLILP